MPTKEVNVGTLWRSAYVFGASFIFTVNKRYERQGSDTIHVENKIPLLHFATTKDLVDHIPGIPLVGVELWDDATAIEKFEHPESACYILGSEAVGLPKTELYSCHDVIQLPGKACLNVAVAGSLVMYDRWKGRQHGN